jgi:hypothetical protein
MKIDEKALNNIKDYDYYELTNNLNLYIFDDDFGLEKEEFIPITKSEIIKPISSNFQDFEENFDIFEYYAIFGSIYFEDKLGPVKLEWSKKMTLCAGVFSVNNSLPVIRLSEPLLKFRTVKEIKETLLHEMIHAYLFIEQVDQSDDKTGHGFAFKLKMNEINNKTGLNITIYHSFHDEVEFYRKHIWRCNGVCREKPPYFGWVKKAINRPPGKSDRWWNDHVKTCNGNFEKIEDESTINKDTKSFEKNKKGKAKKISDNKLIKDFLIKK